MKTTIQDWMIGRRLLAALCLATLVGATSVSAGEGKELDKYAATNEAGVADRISSRFEAFAGSEDNALALVIGLRGGTEITLVETTPATTDPETGEPVEPVDVETVFTPATGAMGYGEIYIALGLARASLVKIGITEPTAAEVVASLNGGIVILNPGETPETEEEVELAGVLALRADGYGWGKVAKTLGLKLGPVMKALKQDARVLKPKKNR
jgi:hypothetical protein